MAVEQPTPKLTAWWCPECGHQHGPKKGPPPKLRHWGIGQTCRGEMEEITYSLDRKSEGKEFIEKWQKNYKSLTEPKD